MNPKPIPREFFGIQIGRISSFYPPQTPLHPELGYGSVRLGDTLMMWRDYEPDAKGKYNQTAINHTDESVKLAYGVTRDVMNTLGQGPDWATGGQYSTIGTNFNANPPKKVQDWIDHVKWIVGRYKDTIRYWEIWNEVDLETEFWAGSTEQMTILAHAVYETVKNIDKNLMVIGPSVTNMHYTGEDSGDTWLDKYYATGGGRWCDIVSVHLYMHPEQPEKTFDELKRLRKVMARYGIDKPIWSTEGTWRSYYDATGALKQPTSSNDLKFSLPDDYAASYLFRSHILAWLAGVERYYWYGLEKFWSSIRLIDPNDLNKLTPAGTMYRTMVDWLVGARLLDHRTTPSGIHYIPAYFADGTSGYFLWTEDNYSHMVRFPGDFTVTSAIRLDGVEQTGAYAVFDLNKAQYSGFTLSKMPVKLVVSGVDIESYKLESFEQPRYYLPYETITATASPFYWRNVYPNSVTINVRGGAVSALRMVRYGTTPILLPDTKGMIDLSPNDELQIEFKEAPVLTLIHR